MHVHRPLCLQGIRWAPPIMTPSVLAFPVYDVGLKPPPRYGRPGALPARLGIAPPTLPPQALADLGFRMPALGAPQPGASGGATPMRGSLPSTASTPPSSLAKSAVSSSSNACEAPAPVPHHPYKSMSLGYASVDTLDFMMLTEAAGPARHSLRRPSHPQPAHGDAPQPLRRASQDLPPQSTLRTSTSRSGPRGGGLYRVSGRGTGPRFASGTGRYPARGAGRHSAGRHGADVRSSEDSQISHRSSTRAASPHQLGTLESESSFDVRLAPPPPPLVAPRKSPPGLPRP